MIVVRTLQFKPNNPEALQGILITSINGMKLFSMLIRTEGQLFWFYWLG
jgi:hypothetical protein